MNPTSGSVGTVAIWGIGIAPVLAIYYALRGEIFSRVGIDSPAARRGRAGFGPFSPRLRGTPRDAYVACFQWLKGYDLSKVPASDKPSPEASHARRKLSLEDSLDGNDADLGRGGENGKGQLEGSTKTEEARASAAADDNSSVARTEPLVASCTDQSVTRKTAPTVYACRLQESATPRKRARKESNTTMSTDEGIDTDMEHEFKGGKPDDRPRDQSDSGFPGNDNIFGEPFLYSTPTRVQMRRLSETNSDIVSRHLEELSGLDYGVSASMGDLHRVPSFKEAGDIALSHTDMMTLMFEDDFEIHRATRQSEVLDTSSDGSSVHLDSGDGLNIEFSSPLENLIGHSESDDPNTNSDWSKFLHIVNVSGENATPGQMLHPLHANSVELDRTNVSVEEERKKYVIGPGTQLAEHQTTVWSDCDQTYDNSSLQSAANGMNSPEDMSSEGGLPLPDTTEEQLFAAIECGAIHEARKLTHRVNLSHRIEGFTVLHQVAIHNMAALIPPLFYFTDFARMMDIPVSNPTSRFHGYTATRIARELRNQQVLDAISEYADVEQSLSDLHKAARAGLPYMVTNLCKEGVAVNGRAKMQISPLYCAATVGRLDIVKILASFGGNLKARNAHSDTLLHRASQLGHKDIAEFLMSRKYDRVEIDAVNEHEETALHKATYHEYVEMVEFLLQNGASPDCPDDCGYTPLHVASCIGNAKMAKLLLNHGGSVDSRDADEWTPLHCAAKYGHLHLVELLLQSGGSVSADTKGLKNTALHVAVENGHHRVAEVLLEAGANTEVRNAYGHSPLHIAAIMNDLKMAEMLTQRGADADSWNGTKKKRKTKVRRLHSTMGGKAFVQVEGVQESDSDGENASPTPLHFAAKHDSMSVVLHLIDRAADVDARDDLGKTPLHYAAEYGHKRVVETLIDHGATVDAADNRCRTPLHYASVNGHADIVDLLLSVGASVQAVTERRNTPLHCAANKGHVTVVERLVQSGAETADTDVYNWTPLHWAAAKEQQRTLELLIKKGADVNGGTSGTTPLHVAAAHGYLQIVEQLIVSGSNVNSKDQENWTPLHYAANEGHLSLVKLLVRRGADVCEIDSHGKTPLHCASMQGSIGVIEFLLLEGAPVEAVDDFLTTSLHVAAGEGNVAAVKLLMVWGADINARDEDYLTPLHYAAKYGRTKVADTLISGGATVDAQDTEAWTPLHYSAYNGHNETSEALLQKGADVESLTAYDNSHLHFAAMRVHPLVVDTLLRHGGPVDQCNKANTTALIMVSKGGHVGLVRKLVKHGADVNIRDSHKRNALHYAAEKGHLLVVGILLDYGVDMSVRDRDGDMAIHLALKNHHQSTATVIYNAMKQSPLCMCAIQ